MIVTAVPVTYSAQAHRAQAISPARSSQDTMVGRPASDRMNTSPVKTMSLRDTGHLRFRPHRSAGQESAQAVFRTELSLARRENRGQKTGREGEMKLTR